ncbi:MAG: PEP-CTERM sorting domain-containing protein [Candidatus Hadarchaeum sp.]
MVKTVKLLGVAVLILVCFCLVLPGLSYSTLIVPSYGETGWQTFVHSQSEGPFYGKVRIGVSNFGNDEYDSVILIDNFKINDEVKCGFESGFSPSIPYGSGGIIPEAYFHPENPYRPTQGTYLAFILAHGVDTSQYGGTYGGYVELSLSLNAGDTVSFDWAFLAMDYSPYADFAFIAVHNDQGQLVDFIKLAQINPVPLPGTLILIGSGLLGIGGLRRKIFKR